MVPELDAAGPPLTGASRKWYPRSIACALRLCDVLGFDVEVSSTTVPVSIDVWID